MQRRGYDETNVHRRFLNIAPPRGGRRQRLGRLLRQSGASSGKPRLQELGCAAGRVSGTTDGSSDNALLFEDWFWRVQRNVWRDRGGSVPGVRPRKLRLPARVLGTQRLGGQRLSQDGPRGETNISLHLLVLGLLQLNENFHLFLFFQDMQLYALI